MKVTTQTVLAGGVINFGEGNYFRLLICPNPVTIVLNGDNGTPVDEFNSVVGGIGFASRDGGGSRRRYGSGSITSPTAQTIVFGYGFGDISYDISQGTVSITQAATLSSLSDVPLAAAGGTLVSAAAVGKRETLVSNLTANVSIMRIGGVESLSASKGVECAPGQTVSISGSAAVYGWNPGAIQSVGVVTVSN